MNSVIAVAGLLLAAFAPGASAQPVELDRAVTEAQYER